jgi:hypothetical protein
MRPALASLPQLLIGRYSPVCRRKLDANSTFRPYFPTTHHPADAATDVERAPALLYGAGIRPAEGLRACGGDAFPAGGGSTFCQVGSH